MIARSRRRMDAWCVMWNKMDNLTFSVARSFTRKLNLGNYESLDVFSSRSEELLASATQEERDVLSERLFLECKKDVTDEMADILAERKKASGVTEEDMEVAVGLIENARIGKPSLLSDYIKIECFPDVVFAINEAKKAYKREQYRKLHPKVEELVEIEEE